MAARQKLLAMFSFDWESSCCTMYVHGSRKQLTRLKCRLNAPGAVQLSRIDALLMAVIWWCAADIPPAPPSPAQPRRGTSSGPLSIPASSGPSRSVPSPSSPSCWGERRVSPLGSSNITLSRFVKNLRCGPMRNKSFITPHVIQSNNQVPAARNLKPTLAHGAGGDAAADAGGGDAGGRGRR